KKLDRIDVKPLGFQFLLRENKWVQNILKTLSLGQRFYWYHNSQRANRRGRGWPQAEIDCATVHSSNNHKGAQSYTHQNYIYRKSFYSTASLLVSRWWCSECLVSHPTPHPPPARAKGKYIIKKGTNSKRQRDAATPSGPRPSRVQHTERPALRYLTSTQVQHMHRIPRKSNKSLSHELAKATQVSAGGENTTIATGFTTTKGNRLKDIVPSRCRCRPHFVF
ncbi:unnamed protein product, partial [Ectocarpus sp. 4 AP-2014]